MLTNLKVPIKSLMKLTSDFQKEEEKVNPQYLYD